MMHKNALFRSPGLSKGAWIAVRHVDSSLEVLKFGEPYPTLHVGYGFGTLHICPERVGYGFDPTPYM